MDLSEEGYASVELLLCLSPEILGTVYHAVVMCMTFLTWKHQLKVQVSYSGYYSQQGHHSSQ